MENGKVLEIESSVFVQRPSRSKNVLDSIGCIEQKLLGFIRIGCLLSWRFISWRLGDNLFMLFVISRVLLICAIQVDGYDSVRVKYRLNEMLTEKKRTFSLCEVFYV
jgi:hypothetical protein